MSNQLPFPPPPKRGSFWHLGGQRDIWTIGTKLLVWGAILGVLLYVVIASALDS